MGDRFFRRGVSKVFFLPAVADPTAVSRAEITAGTDLSVDIADISGYQFENSPINTPNLASSFTPQIDGEDTAPNSSLTFYDRDAADETIRTALAKGTKGFLVLFPYGDVPTERCEVWEISSSGVNDEWSMGNDAARFQVGTSILSPPEQDVPIPAAA